VYQTINDGKGWNYEDNKRTELKTAGSAALRAAGALKSPAFFCADTFVYGGLSHANEEKRRLWKTWMNNPFASTMYENEFTVVLSNIHIDLRNFYYIDRTFHSNPGG